MPTNRAVVAEFVGTFALMFVGGGAIIVTGGENLLAVALAHGLILAVMVSATMHISGGQINPAVSIALWLIKKQSSANSAIRIFSRNRRETFPCLPMANSSSTATGRTATITMSFTGSKTGFM